MGRIDQVKIGGAEWRHGDVMARGTSGPGASGMKSILIVEDSKLILFAAKMALSEAGYKVLTATDGEEALRVARENRPNLIILDMMLPKLSGLDVLQALRKDAATATTRVIVLSSLSQANEAKLKQQGADAYFEKSRIGLDRGCEPLLGVIKNVLSQTP